MPRLARQTTPQQLRVAGSKATRHHRRTLEIAHTNSATTMKLLLHTAVLAGAVCAVGALTTKQPPKQQQASGDVQDMDVSELPNVFEMMDTTPADGYVSREEYVDGFCLSVCVACQL